MVCHIFPRLNFEKQQLGAGGGPPRSLARTLRWRLCCEASAIGKPWKAWISRFQNLFPRSGRCVRETHRLVEGRRVAWDSIHDLITSIDAHPERIEIIQRGLFFGYYICTWATPVHLDPYLYVLLDPEETFFTVLVFRDQRRLQRNRWS